MAIKYRPSMCQQIIDVAKEGGRLASMCVAIGVPSKELFHEWLVIYPDFHDAYVTAQLHLEAFYNERALEASLGKYKGANAKLLELILKAEFPEIYANKDAFVEPMEIEDIEEKLSRLQKELNE